ncbi:Pigment protein [Burkholderia lata]|uniref:Pigment protein n=1 Tax=Burkholderia lata (strain ATCC 17760 / DSM 23089 / LMG 22485 / NCIMB 9086 / R18194 / 383) TaxID=482957 RepID=A0A6P2V1Z2_BURL3|nr:acyl-CoA dehydrogenase [Burkholderia lata]VWC77200.1 Pigment protein [Burkholderia lata]
MSANTTEQQWIKKAEELAPLLREMAPRTEELRTLSPAVADACRTSGVFRLLQPASYGGAEADYDVLLKVLEIMATGCPSTAWVGFNAASHNWMLAMWPKSAQDEVWGADADAVISSSLIYPAGKATLSDDGSEYTISGAWPFSSGVNLASWVMLGATVQNGESQGRRVIALVPKSQINVIDVWHVAGLTGTGSNNLEAKDLSVRREWVVDAESLSNATAPGLEINKAPIFKAPIFGLFPHLVAAVVLGNARGAYDEFIAGAAQRKTTYARLTPAQLVPLHLRIAEVAALITSSRLLLQADAEEAMRIARTGEATPMADQIRWRRNAAFAATQGTRAMDLLFAAYGGGGIYKSNHAQQRFRDAHAAISHIQVSWDINATEFGRLALGA